MYVSKKLLAWLCAAALGLGLAACAARPASSAPAATPASSQVVSSAAPSASQAPSSAASSSVSSGADAAKALPPSSAPAVRVPSDPRVQKTAQSSKVAGAASAPSATRPSGQAAASVAPQPSRSPVSAPAKNTLRISMEVECGNAVHYGNRIARKVAPNGILYAKRGMTLAKGATAYDALKRTGLVLDSKTSAFGVYIRAIQSLAEKACGPQSGWMYTVNGQIASVGCGAYELRDGDTVRWRYSCNMGRDL